MKVLGVYHPKTLEPIAIGIPDALAEAAEKALSQGKDIQFKGKTIPNRLIMNQDYLFNDMDEFQSVKLITTPSQAEKQSELRRQKTMEELRQEVHNSEWYRRARAARVRRSQ